MPSIRKVRIIRFIEKTTLVVLIVWIGVLATVYGLGYISNNELYASIGVVILLLALLLYIQTSVDTWLVVLISQNSFAEEDVFDSLYERSPVAYLTLSTKGKILNTNPSAVKLLGGNTKTFKGLNFYSFIEESGDIDVEVFKGKVEGGVTINDKEVQMKTIDQQTVWAMVSVFPYRNSGERLVSLVDVTEQKNVDTAKSEFVALATHQLRTPIAAIRWNVELLERSLKEIKTEAQDRYLTKIERNVLRMINLINDFLSVSKLEMGTYAAEEVELNLTEFFSSIEEEFTEKIIEKQITLNRQDQPPQTIIRTDSRLIHIVVSNLMSNAVKYSKNNSALTFSYELVGDKVQIIVADDGIGIPEGELDKLFTKFYRASNAQSHQTEGTGLGLYIVKQSVEQLGGEISVESRENDGAKFVVQIPTTNF
ncbi:PAS domain-containing sensor histidine kinase [Candidatus Nomurabacteria bacterium]|nr:PAS domain-containing sensor histidine kinase [Candidatus Kaiserbacteria bacterium]MCB9815219.1 PAS domain-containing sensor histidine kinase [Candidatus Nomurabacteria bacterium]